MYIKSRLILFGSSVALGLALSSCAVEDPNREKVEMEKWTTGPDGNTYTYMKCEGARRYMATFCGQKTTTTTTAPSEGQATPYTYNWQTNCNGANCATVSVFAHYAIGTDLGAGQTLRIEAFDNPQFRSTPVASLDIVGFNTSRPNSTDREEIYLAPGEYYFRAYITHEGDSPVPYPLQGMELVSDRPVGFLGASSGAERVVIEGPSDQKTIHIAIDQLYEKAVPEAESFAKLRLQIAVDAAVTIPHARDFHIVLSKEADLEAKADYDFTINTNELLVTGQERQTDFLSPSLDPGTYYVFTYIDANGNGLVDPEESSAYVLEGKDPAEVKIEKDRTRSVKVQIVKLPAAAI